MNPARVGRDVRKPTRAARSLKRQLDTLAEGRTLSPGSLSVAQRIVAALTASGRCLQCGRKLTDPESLAIVVGPDCLEKFGGRQAWEHRIGALTRQGGST